MVSDEDLDALFVLSRQRTPVVSQRLLARVLLDARQNQPRPAWWRRIATGWVWPVGGVSVATACLAAFFVFVNVQNQQAVDDFLWEVEALDGFYETMSVVLDEA